MKYTLPDIETLDIVCIPRCGRTTLKKCSKCIFVEEKCLNQCIEQIKNTISNLCNCNNMEKFCKVQKCENCNEFTYDYSDNLIFCPHCRT